MKEKAEQLRKEIMIHSNPTIIYKKILAAFKDVAKGKDSLIKIQDEYIQFLSNHISKNAVYLSVHGITTSDKDVKTGEELREEIEYWKSLTEK